MKYEIMTFKLLQYHIVKYDTVVNKYLGGKLLVTFLYRSS